MESGKIIVYREWDGLRINKKMQQYSEDNSIKTREMDLEYNT